jgi:hypothetical protein
MRATPAILAGHRSVLKRPTIQPNTIRGRGFEQTFDNASSVVANVVNTDVRTVVPTQISEEAIKPIDLG